jgi:hypothetical protein
MQTVLFSINNDASEYDIAPEVLSFRPFIAYLKKRIRKEKSIKGKFYQFILEQFDNTPELRAKLQVHEAASFESLLELVYASLSPVAIGEENYLWALSTPIPNEVIYCTDSFYEFIAGGNPDQVKSSFTNNASAFIKRQTAYLYRLILKRLYNFETKWGTDVHYTYKNIDTGLNQYYRIHADTSFIDIAYKGKLPALTFADIEYYLHQENGLEQIAEVLPLKMFTFSGFSVITMEDVTSRYAIEEIRNAILDHAGTETYVYDRVIQALKTLAGDNKIEFGLLPFIKMNGKLVFDKIFNTRSILMRSADELGLAEEAFSTMAANYEKNPKAVFFSSIDEAKQGQYGFLKAIKHAGIASYALIPVFYNKHLSGTLEVYSRTEHALFENILSKLEFTLPLLAQLLQHSSDNFHIGINKVLTEKFTALQPSVQWKFNEVAWNYLKASLKGGGKQDIETVCFKNVYPLYGAIDIRNSTAERNKAMQLDMCHLLTLLSKTFNELNIQFKVPLPTGMADDCVSWIEKVEEVVSTTDELELEQFLHHDAGLFLAHYTAEHPEVENITAEFLNYVNGIDTSIATKHRSDLERSMHLINDSLNTYLEQARHELQKQYPCYFEKFRTDGVEYDMYVGQSIAPMEPFTEEGLNAIRLWQLRSMINIACLTNSLMPDLLKPLETTQLIFIHTQSIDISFRNDERRFDVEGAYNIRYEVIKKRIDKVLLKETGERLTQPGKIALVYFNADEEEMYTSYIKLLQKENLLLNDLEYLELEELQGVTGLMAMRVGVNFITTCA